MSKKKEKNKNIYFVGLKGVGLTMLAQFLASRGNKVSGSDIKDVFLTDKVLRDAKIKVFSPFDTRNIPDKLDRLIYSTAYNFQNNPELAFVKNNPARFKNVRVLSYPEALGEIFNQYYGLAVCGSHGKTTVTAWLGYVLWCAGKKPNVLVGSRVPQFRGSALVGAAKYFVAEVDEYQNKLRYFQPRGVILNNIDYDHPDYFKTPAAYTKVFADFVKKIPARGFLIVNRRDQEIRKIKRHNRGRTISYDLVTGASIAANKMSVIAETLAADYLAYDWQKENGRQFFRVACRGGGKGGRGAKYLGRFEIALWGEHNILNALAVIATARELKVSLPAIKKHLAAFRGTERRAQILGKYRGALLIDDYAHHPTEIRETLKGLRDRYPDRKILTVFHPHTFTRTKAFFADFARSFIISDELIILDIYGSAREKQGGTSSRQLAAAVRVHNRNHGIVQTVKHIPSMTAAVKYLKNKLGNGDLLLLMGAGDVFRVGDRLLSSYARNKKQPAR
jgi:UDP-N-acetylmuramate--alanine ligase